ncbi:transcriptional regulator [Sphingomonas sp. LH128]|nr:transcriptional regulator [Sphingomonas sp. LH128]
MAGAEQYAPATPAPTFERRSFASQVSLITRLLRKRFDERARAMALPNGETLTRAQWRMLGAIHLNEGSTQREVAERLEIGPVAAGQSIDRLEQSKWVERRADPADRRVKRLYVTDAALPVLAQLGLLGNSEDQRAIVGIPSEDMRRLTTLLDDVIANLRVPER